MSPTGLADCEGKDCRFHQPTQRNRRVLEPHGPAATLRLPVISTPSLTLNIALVEDFPGAAFVGVRDPIRVEFGYSDSDRTNNLRTLRVEETAAPGHRPGEQGHQADLVVSVFKAPN